MIIGYRKQGLNIMADPSATVEGMRLTVSSTELRALDRYERLGIRYSRIRVTLEDGSTAWVYQRIEPDADALPVPAQTNLHYRAIIKIVNQIPLANPRLRFHIKRPAQA
jgi:hypothetical protein